MYRSLINLEVSPADPGYVPDVPASRKTGMGRSGWISTCRCGDPMVGRIEFETRKGIGSGSKGCDIRNETRLGVASDPR